MKKWLAMGALGIAAGVLTFYLHQERGDQPALADVSEQSSANPVPIPAPLQPTNVAPAEPASQEAPPSALPSMPFRDEFQLILEKIPGFTSRWETEVRDPLWAQAAEDGLLNFYSGNADLMAQGRPNIECRKTLCMVRIMASGIDDPNELMGMGRKKSTKPIVLPAGTGLSQISVSMGDQQEGRATAYLVLVHYTRTDEKP